MDLLQGPKIRKRECAGAKKKEARMCRGQEEGSRNVQGPSRRDGARLASMGHGAWDGVRVQVRWAAIPCSAEQRGWCIVSASQSKGRLRLGWCGLMKDGHMRLAMPPAWRRRAAVASGTALAEWRPEVGEVAARWGKRSGRMQAAAAAAVVADAAGAAGALATAEAAGVFVAAAAAVGWDWRQKRCGGHCVMAAGWNLGGAAADNWEVWAWGRKCARLELLLLWSLFPQQGVLPKLGRVRVRPEEEELSTASCQPGTLLRPAQPGPCGRWWSREWPR